MKRLSPLVSKYRARLARLALLAGWSLAIGVVGFAIGDHGETESDRLIRAINLSQEENRELRRLLRHAETAAASTGDKPEF